MTTLTLLLLLASVDPRLASVAKVYVVAVDQLGDDRPVATCVIAHLPQALPLDVVTSSEEADLVVKVRAEVQGPLDSGWVTTTAWIGDKKVVDIASRLRMTSSAGRRSLGEDHCALADAAIDDLRRAIRKARGAR